jgi:hypothetical protein
MNIEPKRDPRPQDEEGTYRCYDARCDAEADIVTPRRIESTGIDPVQTVVTYCLKCYLAWEVLDVTGKPLEAALEIEEDLTEEFGDKGYMKERLYPRLLANVILFDDPRGSDPPSPDSELGDIFDHAGERGEEIREMLETPIEEQLAEYENLVPDSEVEQNLPGEESDLSEFT